MSLFGKNQERSNREPDSRVRLVDESLLEEQLRFSQLLKRVLQDVFSQASVATREKVMDYFQTDPSFSQDVIRLLMKSVRVEFPEMYLDEIAKSILAKDQVVLLGPHWSVADIAGVIKIVERLQLQPNVLMAGHDPVALAPASSKFFDSERADSMFARSLVAAIEGFHLKLYQVAQIQDTEIQATKSSEEIRGINTKAWKTIIRGMKQGKMLSIFPEGTRSRNVGTGRAPLEVCTALDKVLKPNALLSPFAVLGSHEYLGVGMPYPNLLKPPTMMLAQPIRKYQAKFLATMIGGLTLDQDEERPIHTLEVPTAVVLLDQDEKYWGELRFAIVALKNLVALYGSLSNLLIAADQQAQNTYD